MARTIGLLFPKVDEAPFKEDKEVKEVKQETKKKSTKKTNKEKED